MIVATASQDFYAASAQVIPVLLLVLAFELVRYRQPQEPLFVAYSFMGSVLGMIFGEVAALGALAAGTGTHLTAAMTSLGLATGLSVVFIRAGLLAGDNLRKERSTAVAERFTLVTTIGGIVVMIGVTVLLQVIAI